jgi:hypothetical protein
MTQRLRRWRLVLGGDDADGTGQALDGDDVGRDGTLAALYDSDRRGGLGRSAPQAVRWLGDIRTYFPTTVVQVLQRDAIDRLGLTELLLEPELLDALEPDVNLAATLVSLRDGVPDHARESARRVIQGVTDDLTRRLADSARQSIRGSLNRASRTSRPRPGDIDWARTVTANLKHYQPAHRTVIPEKLIGFGRRNRTIERELVLVVDQSASMARSVVYASVFAAALAGVPALATRVIAFDTSVVDLTAELDDPVDLLFGMQLGGGTDIAGAIAYAETKITNPSATILVLLSDLYEGGDAEALIRRMGRLTRAGVRAVALLALDDDGAPASDHTVADALADLGIPAFACTPDKFGELLAAAVDGRDLGRWAATEGLTTAAPT